MIVGMGGDLGTQGSVAASNDRHHQFSTACEKLAVVPILPSRRQRMQRAHRIPLRNRLARQHIDKTTLQIVYMRYAISVTQAHSAFSNTTSHSTPTSPLDHQDGIYAGWRRYAQLGV